MRIPNKAPEFEKMSQMEKMVQENLKTSQETLERVKKINKYIFWQKVWGWTRFFIILIPIILAVIYLPGYIRKAYELYQKVLSPFAAGTGGAIQNIEGLIEQLQGFSNQGNQIPNLKQLFGK